LRCPNSKPTKKKRKALLQRLSTVQGELFGLVGDAKFLTTEEIKSVIETLKNISALIERYCNLLELVLTERQGYDRPGRI